jgi:hypothetical protein
VSPIAAIRKAPEFVNYVTNPWGDATPDEAPPLVAEPGSPPAVLV